MICFRLRGTTRTEVDGTMGWGTLFPSGLVVVDWRLEAFPPGDRLQYAHASLYGSIADVERATGGEVVDERDLRDLLKATLKDPDRAEVPDRADV